LCYEVTAEFQCYELTSRGPPLCYELTAEFTMLRTYEQRTTVVLRTNGRVYNATNCRAEDQPTVALVSLVNFSSTATITSRGPPSCYELTSRGPPSCYEVTSRGPQSCYELTAEFQCYELTSGGPTDGGTRPTRKLEDHSRATNLRQSFNATNLRAEDQPTVALVPHVS
jgi:hypothetical protein